jgi:hypothetical protein
MCSAGPNFVGGDSLALERTACGAIGEVPRWKNQLTVLQNLERTPVGSAISFTDYSSDYTEDCRRDFETIVDIAAIIHGKRLSENQPIASGLTRQLVCQCSSWDLDYIRSGT